MEKSLTPEKDKWEAFLKEEKKMGLKSVHVTWTDEASALSLEERYAELNRMREAPRVELPNID